MVLPSRPVGPRQHLSQNYGSEAKLRIGSGLCIEAMEPFVTAAPHWPRWRHQQLK